MKHFRSPKVESDALVDSGVFRQSPSAYFATSPREQSLLRTNRCGHLDYQGAIRTGIEPALSEYKSAVCQNEPSIAVDTFIYFSRHHFTVGFEPTTSRSNPGRYTKLSHSTIAVGAFIEVWFRIDGSSIQGRLKNNLHCWLALW